MRKVLAVLAVLAIVAGSASAFDLEAGLYSGSITDRSNVYSGGNQPDDDSDYALPETPGSPVNVGDEQRTVFSLDALSFGVLDVNPFSGDVKITETGPSVTYTPKNLKGVLYDINVSGITNGVPVAGDGLLHDIYKTPGGRYTSTGGTDGTWTDTVASPSVGLVTSAGGYGGLLVIYEDPTAGTPTNPFSAGPSAWREPGQPGHVASPLAGVLSDSDNFPGITDQGLVWLVAVLTPLPASAYNFPVGAPAGTVLVEKGFSVDSGGTGDASGIAFANIIGGSAASLFMLDIFGAGRDIRIDFDIDFDANGTVDGWQVESDDPVQFGAIPEPATLTLLGLGLASLGVIRRRK